MASRVRSDSESVEFLLGVLSYEDDECNTLDFDASDVEKIFEKYCGSKMYPRKYKAESFSIFLSSGSYGVIIEYEDDEGYIDDMEITISAVAVRCIIEDIVHAKIKTT